MKQVRVHDATLSFGSDKKVEGIAVKGYRWGPHRQDLFALGAEAARASSFISARVTLSEADDPVDRLYHNVLLRSAYFFQCSSLIVAKLKEEGL